MRAQGIRPAASIALAAGLRFAAGMALAAGPFAYWPARAQPATDSLGANPLGATVEGLLEAGQRLSPALRAASLDTAAASAKADGAGRLDDPTIADNYEYYRDPGVFSGHAVMVSQAFPLWGKRDLRRQAALADVDAARGQERAARDALDEKIKVAYAQYYLASRDIAVNREIAQLAQRMRSAAAARYGQNSGDQTSVIAAMGEETNAKTEAVRLQGEKAAAVARLNALIGRPGDARLAEPERLRPIPPTEPPIAALSGRARSANPTLRASDAAVAAARARDRLAGKAWYPDVTLGAGPLIQTNNQPAGFAASVGFNIPVPWGREASGQREAAAQLGAAQQKYEAATREIEGALGEAVARLRAARTTEALLRREAMPQARAAFDAVLASYSQGKTDLGAAIAVEHQLHDIDLRLLQAQMDEQVECAGIERLIGGPL